MEKQLIESKKISVGNYALLMSILKGDLYLAQITDVCKIKDVYGSHYYIVADNKTIYIIANTITRGSERINNYQVLDIFTKSELQEAKTKIKIYYKKIKEIKILEKSARLAFDSLIKRTDLMPEDIQNIKNDEKTTRLLESMKGI